jgi:hypothetical protein
LGAITGISISLRKTLRQGGRHTSHTTEANKAEGIGITALGDAEEVVWARIVRAGLLATRQGHGSGGEENDGGEELHFRGGGWWLSFEKDEVVVVLD